MQNYYLCHLIRLSHVEFYIIDANTKNDDDDNRIFSIPMRIDVAHLIYNT